MPYVGVTPIDPHLRKWMLFVDGENLTFRAQEYAKQTGMDLEEGKWFQKDVFVWFPNHKGTAALTNTSTELVKVQDHSIRSYYYTSAVGDDKRILEIKESLHDIGFNPSVFKKEKQSRKSKGVDIALSVDLLSNAYYDNFDVAVLIAGDGDYLPLVNEVKRLGKIVYIGFFLDGENGMSKSLMLASDKEFEISKYFTDQWKKSKEYSKDAS